MPLKELLPEPLIFFGGGLGHILFNASCYAPAFLHLLRRNGRVHRRPGASSSALLQYHFFIELPPEILFFFGQRMAPEGADLGEEPFPTLDVLR